MTPRLLCRRIWNLCQVKVTACFTSAYAQNCLPARCFLMGLNEQMSLGHANFTSHWLRRYRPTFLQPPSRTSYFHIVAFLEQQLAGKWSTKGADVKQTVTFWMPALVTDLFYAGTTSLVDALRLMSTCQWRIREVWHIRSATHVPYVFTSQNKVYDIRTFVIYFIKLIRNNNYTIIIWSF
jgi:hypothetical protein